MNYRSLLRIASAAGFVLVGFVGGCSHQSEISTQSLPGQPGIAATLPPPVVPVGDKSAAPGAKPPPPAPPAVPPPAPPPKKK